jgi:hypothetical protein
MKIVKGNAFLLILACICSLYVIGCSTPVQQVGTDVLPIVLKEPQTGKLSVGTISVPAGIYEPDFEANNGIYYRAPTHLIGKALGMTFIQRGGIFIPFPPTEKDKADIEARKSMPPIDPRNHASQTTAQTLPPEKDFRMGVWYDQQESSGGLIGYAATSPKRIFRVDEPFVYETQKLNSP